MRLYVVHYCQTSSPSQHICRRIEGSAVGRVRSHSPWSERPPTIDWLELTRFGIALDPGDRYDRSPSWDSSADSPRRLSRKPLETTPTSWINFGATSRVADGSPVGRALRNTEPTGQFVGIHVDDRSVHGEPRVYPEPKGNSEAVGEKRVGGLHEGVGVVGASQRPGRPEDDEVVDTRRSVRSRRSTLSAATATGRAHHSRPALLPHCARKKLLIPRCEEQ